MRTIKKQLFLTFMILVFLCSMGIQPALTKKPVLTKQYKLEFEAEATGTFLVFSGILGEGDVPVVAVGVGDCKMDRNYVAVNEVMDDIYFDFPAEVKMDGEIKGVVSPVASNGDNGIVVAEETWNLELEFWNLTNAGGMFAPEEDIFVFLANMMGSSLETCIGYKLELEEENGDESEIKLTGEALAVGAGNIAMGEEQVIELILNIDDDPYTILFMHQIELIYPELEPTTVEVCVELDVD